MTYKFCPHCGKGLTGRDDLTEIVCVIDRSSSMAPNQQEVIDGFNNFIRDQKKLEGEAVVSLTLFDTKFDMLLESSAVTGLPGSFLNKENYAPSGCTSLLDAIGRTIDAVNERHSGLSHDKRPGKVIFLIMTDGQENSSQQYLGDKVPKMIKAQQEERKWEFVFIGANVDSFHLAQSYNIPTYNTANFVSTVKGGTTRSFVSLGDVTTRYRKTGKTGGVKSTN